MNLGGVNIPKETNVSNLGNQQQLNQIQKTHEQHEAIIDDLGKKLLYLKEEVKIPDSLTPKELKTLSNFQKDVHERVSYMEKERGIALSKLGSAFSENDLQGLEDRHTNIQVLVEKTVSIQERVDLLKDVRKEISAAKDHYQDLKLEYQGKQNTLFKDGRKELSNAGVIENQLKGIKDHIHDLEALEKKLTGTGISNKDSALIDQGKSQLSSLSLFIQSESKAVSASIASNDTKSMSPRKVVTQVVMNTIGPKKVLPQKSLEQSAKAEYRSPYQEVCKKAIQSYREELNQIKADFISAGKPPPLEFEQRFEKLVKPNPNTDMHELLKMLKNEFQVLREDHAKLDREVKLPIEEAEALKGIILEQQLIRQLATIDEMEQSIVTMKERFAGLQKHLGGNNQELRVLKALSSKIDEFEKEKDRMQEILMVAFAKNSAGEVDHTIKFMDRIEEVSSRIKNTQGRILDVLTALEKR